MPLPNINWKRILCIILVCTFIAAISAMIVFLGRPWGVIDSTVLMELPKDTSAIFFLGHIYKINIPDLTMTVSWLIGGCGNLTLWTAPAYTWSVCGSANVPIDIYIDGALRHKYDPTLHPIRNYPSINETLYTQALNQFQYTHTMDISNYKLPQKIGGSFRAFEQRYFYPFEEYRLITTFVAVNSETNASLPILRLAFTDFVDNFEPQTTEYSTNTFLNNTLMSSRTAYAHIQRTSSARTFVMIIFTLSWFLTGMVVYITSVALSSNTKLSDGIVVLPMTMILTLPALRQLYVDGPSFGVLLDSLGLIIQMVIVAICSIVLLLDINTRNTTPQETSSTLDDDTDDSETLTNDSKTLKIIEALRINLQVAIGAAIRYMRNRPPRASKSRLKDHDCDDLESLHTTS